MAKILLNKQNLFHNLDIISKQAKGNDKVAIVLKDNAYGHGLLEIAQLASEFGIKKAVVRTLDEALKIENYFDSQHKMMLLQYPYFQNALIVSLLVVLIFSNTVKDLFL